MDCTRQFSIGLRKGVGTVASRQEFLYGSGIYLPNEEIIT